MKEPSLRVDEAIMRKLQRGEMKAVLMPDGSIEEMPPERLKPISPVPPEPEEPEEMDEPEAVAAESEDPPQMAKPISPVTPAQTEQVVHKKLFEKPTEAETADSIVNMLKAEIAHYTEAQKNYWAGYQDGFIRALDTISRKAE